MKKIIISAITLLFLFCSSCGFYVPVSHAESSLRRQIIIDPGHGGVDGGAVGYSGIIEKDVNLSLSNDLKCLLLFMGYDVIMTRETDVSIHDDNATSIRQMKSSDLRNRLKIANEHGDAAYLSIHQNNFHDSSQSGMCFYYSPNSPQSRQLAESFRNSMLQYLQPNNKRQLKEAGNTLFIMYNAQNPAVLVECGFLSNPEEEKKLCDKVYHMEISLVLLSGLSKAGL